MHKNKTCKPDQAKNPQVRESGLIKAFATFQTEGSFRPALELTTVDLAQIEKVVSMAMEGAQYPLVAQKALD
jgi:hypothetical protein